ncbi:hypothetical protein Plhal304r1_c068g0156111 [Plasmopara halstedii]
MEKTVSSTRSQISKEQSSESPNMAAASLAVQFYIFEVKGKTLMPLQSKAAA